MRIRLIGTLQVSGAHGKMDAGDFPSRKSAQVLAVLALAGGRPVAKERLVDQIWGDRLPEDPFGALEQAVSVLRRALRSVTDERVVLTRAGQYQLDPQRVTVDAAELSGALGASAGAADDVERERVLWEALEPVDGELLSDERPAPWVEHARERLRAEVEHAWLDVARLAAGRGDDRRAAHAAARARSLALGVHDEAYSIEALALARVGDHHRASELVGELERRTAEERREARVDLDALRAACSVPAAPAERIRTSIAHVPQALTLVGRDGTIDAVMCAWVGRSSVILVEAPAGFGRTSLLAALRERASADRRVLSIACHRGDRDQPLLLAARVVRAMGSATGRARNVRPTESTAVAFERIAALADRVGPLVIVVDDVHRADGASVAALAALAAPDSGAGVHLVASARSAFADAVADAIGPVRRITLGALTADDLEGIGLAGAMQETAGHPATLAACCAAARRDGVLDAAEVLAVRARLDELPVEHQAVVAAAAAGRSPSATVRALAARTGRTRPEVATALAAAGAAGLVSVEHQRVRVIPDILRRLLAGRING